NEFDFPQGDENATNRYDGQGGVPIPSFFHRLLYAYDFSNFKILISNYFTGDSKILYHRQIRDRIRRVAPFLRLDQDPYITLINGRLHWIVDGYTSSDRYPYSEPFNQNINYIRNSVKVLIDAYDGTMQFFIVDSEDPVLQTYQRIFPDLFTANTEIPDAVKAHFRYPQDFFMIQAQMYLSYHMDNPDVFYNQEDLWKLPTQLYEGNEEVVEPYYIIMQLPQAESEEFMLILPFTPVNKDNMVAWMAARSDGEQYGTSLLYEFPKQQLVYGPKQIEARIDQNPTISQQLTLWSQEGSNVIRGDLLVIPINTSLLYVEPIYLRAEQGELPELRRVIVAYDEQVVMEETLDEALAVIFGDGLPSQEATEETQPTPTAPINNRLIQSALDTYQQAQEALQNGNWSEYGELTDQLEEILLQLNGETE
ncbi:MAG: COG1615 family transporter, partial [Kamptonema sp. SIO4C4]|nr:COG1615 family transporter [Kamptonema sp. SIO4C4]